MVPTLLALTSAGTPPAVTLAAFCRCCSEYDDERLKEAGRSRAAVAGVVRAKRPRQGEVDLHALPDEGLLALARPPSSAAVVEPPHAPGLPNQNTAGSARLDLVCCHRRCLAPLRFTAGAREMRG